jgi:hypothetical protein
MTRARTAWLVMVVLAAVGAAPAQGQVHWESPMVLPPADQAGLGVYLIDAAGGGLGVLGVWRTAQAPTSMGLRGGIADDSPRRDGNGIAAFFGVDMVGRLARTTAEFPLDIDWLVGAGASIGDRFLVSVPLGVTLGHRFHAEALRFVPFLTPRVVLGGTFAGGGLGLDLAVDLGIDLTFQPAWSVRFAGTFADRGALGIGIVF